MPFVIPVALSCILFIESLDVSVLVTALPAIARDLGTTPDRIKLALTAFFAAMACGVPASGWVADRLGAGRVVRIAVGGFVAGALVCALATSLQMLVAGRFIQGLGAAFMSPIARVLLVRLTPREQLMAATSLFTVPTVIAPMIGPPLGGFIATYLDWRLVFLVTLPLALGAVILLSRLLPPDPKVAPRRFDLRGYLLLAIGFPALIFGLPLIAQGNLPLWIRAGLPVLGLLACGLYLLHARRVARPVLDLRVLANPGLRAATIGAVVILIGCSAIPYLTTLTFQLGFGMTAFAAGLLMLAGSGGALVAKALTAPLFARHGYRRVMIATALLAGLGIGVKSFLPAATPVLAILALLFINGLIRSIFFTGNAVLAVADTPSEDLADATAITTVARQLASAMSLILAGALLAGMADPVTGNAPGDYQRAMWASAILVALSAVAFLRLPRKA